MSAKKGSTFLDSDSDSDSVRSFGSEDSSDESLPKYNICTPEKRQRLQSSTSNGVLPRTPASRQLSTPTANHVSRPRQDSITPTTSKKQLDFSSTFGRSSTHGGTVSERTVGTPASASSHLLSPSRASGSGNSISVNGSSSSVSTAASLGFYSPSRPPPPSSSPSSSPMQLSERHGKALQQYNKLTRKMEPLTADIKSRMEKNSKLKAYRQSGGIRGLSSGVEKTNHQSVSSECEEDARSALVNYKARQRLKEDDKFPLPAHPPGLPMLIHPAELLSMLRPPEDTESESRAVRSPTETEGPSTQFNGMDYKVLEDSGFLHHFISTQWLLTEYTSEMCPLHIWKWLFDISCKSCDISLGRASLTNLTSLLEVAQQASHENWPVLVPGPSLIIDTLADLGVDRVKLRMENLVKGRLVEKGSSQQNVKVLAAVVSGLTNLFTYLDKSTRCRPGEMTPDTVCHMVLLTAAVSLDSALLQLQDVGLTQAISNALSSLLDCVPEDRWSEWYGKVASSLQALSTHHHDCVHICDVILSSSRRSEELRRLVIQHQLSSVVSPGNTAAKVSMKDWKLTYSVVKFYYDKVSSMFDYYAMYSSMCLLGMLLASSRDNDWPSTEEADVKFMFSNLGSVRIKDDVDHVDKVPVKDLFINFRLEMDSRKKNKALKQSNLFDYC